MANPFDSSLPWGEVMPRPEQLARLAAAGHRVPRHAAFWYMRLLDLPLVLHHDVLAHCGEGKALWHPGDPPPRSHTFAVEFIGKPGCSNRTLVIGEYRFHLAYESDDWRSNVGGECRLLYQSPRDATDLIRLPVYAIDFVMDLDWQPVAIDFNTTPGIPLDVINRVGRERLREAAVNFWRAECER